MDRNDELFVRSFLTGLLLHDLNCTAVDVGVGHPVHVRTPLPGIQQQRISEPLPSALWPMSLILGEFFLGPGMKLQGAIAGRTQAWIMLEPLDGDGVSHQRSNTFEQNDSSARLVRQLADNGIDMFTL